jgi:hypothetical protein
VLFGYPLILNTKRVNCPNAHSRTNSSITTADADLDIFCDHLISPLHDDRSLLRVAFAPVGSNQPHSGIATEVIEMAVDKPPIQTVVGTGVGPGGL